MLRNSLPLWSLLALALPLGNAAGQPGVPEGQKRGVTISKEGAFEGYTLIAPLNGSDIYLVDMEGRAVHEWRTGLGIGSQYLLENGHLLLCARQPDAPRFQAGGQGGRIQELDWDGTVLWDYTFATEEGLQHHDIAWTPDETVLFIAYEYFPQERANEVGRDPSAVGAAGLWLEAVYEVMPLPPDDGEIIWEWHVSDHLIQDRHPDLPHFGTVADHPELVDINAGTGLSDLSPEEIDRLVALGYMTGAPTGAESRADWLHLNAINYHPELDQIALSTPNLSEIWIIDHSTSIAEAAGHEGGSAGRGGDLLYRWGNPATYDRGDESDQRLFFQHDVQWIPAGLPGEGHLLLFNNGQGRSEPPHSSILELVTPLQSDDSYALAGDAAYGPDEPVWEYTASPPGSFYSSFISGTQRLPNGNTLICEGDKGRVFEVTPAGEIVWEYLANIKTRETLLPAGVVPPFALFRATRIAADHPGLESRELNALAGH